MVNLDYDHAIAAISMQLDIVINHQLCGQQHSHCSMQQLISYGDEHGYRFFTQIDFTSMLSHDDQLRHTKNHSYDTLVRINNTSTSSCRLYCFPFASLDSLQEVT